MTLIIKIVFICISLYSCTHHNAPVPPKQLDTKPVAKNINDCICITLWMPVCGEDKKTYSNSCNAECAGVKYTQGACENYPEK